MMAASERSAIGVYSVPEKKPAEGRLVRDVIGRMKRPKGDRTPYPYEDAAACPLYGDCPAVPWASISRDALSLFALCSRLVGILPHAANTLQHCA
ncbi:MAG: hypothetical protein LBP19_03775 [Treponema sp.]|nr:hypothetical protein [Treponema sp.]